MLQVLIVSIWRQTACLAEETYLNHHEILDLNRREILD